MALNDILQAILEHTDREIAQMQDASLRRKNALSEETGHALETYGDHMKQNHEEFTRQQTVKSKSTVQLNKKSELLKVRRSCIEEAYEEALTTIASASENTIKPLLSYLLGRIKGKGTIRASKKHEKLLSTLSEFDKTHWQMGDPLDSVGGFIFIGDIREEDFTFEHLLQQIVRPETEIDVARILFS